MKKIYLFLLLLLSAALLFACKGSQNDDPEMDPDKLTPEQVELFSQTYSDINKVAMVALASENPVEELKKIVEQFKGHSAISSIYVDNESLVVEFEGIVRFYWKDFSKYDHDDLAPLKVPHFRGSELRADNTQAVYPKYLFIYTHTLDADRKDMNEWVKNKIEVYRNEGCNITTIYGSEFDRAFIKEKGLAGYDAIFIDTHGLFDARKGETYLMTGEKEVVKNFLEKITKSLFQESGVTIFNGGYIAISQKYIDQCYATGDFGSNTFFYSGACQTMMDPQRRFAQVLVNKGIAKVVGFTERTKAGVAINYEFKFMRELFCGFSYKEIAALTEPRTNTYICHTKDHVEVQGTQHTYPLRQENYDAHGNFLYAADFASYPGVTDFGFERVVRLDRYSIEMVEKSSEVIKVESGSNNYTVTATPESVATAKLRDGAIQVEAHSAGEAIVTLIDNTTNIRRTCKIVVKSHQQKIDEIIPPEYVQILKDMGVAIHEGKNPPIIEGCYLVSPALMTKTNRSNDFPIGHQFNDIRIQFYDQNNKTYNIKLREWQSNTTSASIETSVTSGTGNKFTVYGKVRGEETEDPSIYTVMAMVYTGEYREEGIKDLQISFVMIEKNDPHNRYIPVGAARVVADGDQLSPTVEVPSARALRSIMQGKALTYIHRYR